MMKNIGLQARILSTRTFTIFVVMALLTTFATTPLATVLYPPWYQEKLKAWRRGEIDWDTGAPLSGTTDAPDSETKASKPATDRIRRLLVYLTLDSMPSMLDLVSLFGMPSKKESRAHPADRARRSSADTASILDPTAAGSSSERATRAHGVRLIQLTDRDSSVMTVSQVNEYGQDDPLVNIFRTLGQLHKLAVSGEVAVMPETRFAEALVSKSSATSSDLLLVPWGETGTSSAGQSLSADTANAGTRLASSYATFISPILQASEHNIALFVSKAAATAQSEGQQGGLQRGRLARAHSFSAMQHDIPAQPVASVAHHIYLPYFGGADDELALMLVLQLCEKPDVTATVVYFHGVLDADTAHDGYFAEAKAEANSTSSRLGLRVKFEAASHTDAIGAALERATAEIQPGSRDVTWHNLIVVGRRSASKLGGAGLGKVAEEVKEGLGVPAAGFVASGLKADMLVIQAKSSLVK